MASMRRVVLTVVGCVALTACSSSDSASADSGPAVITVSGTVVDVKMQPYSGPTVLITSGAFNKSVATDASGAFTVSGVPTPYVATILDSTAKLVVQYQGLTRADPTLTDIVSPLPDRSAIVSGTLTGGMYPETSAYTTSFAFVSPQTVSPLPDAQTAAYSSVIQWRGPTSTTGTLYALQVHNVVGLPTDYPGYGMLPNVAFQDMATAPGKNISLGPVTAATLSGTVSAPAGYAVSAKGLSLLAAPGAVLSVLNDHSLGTAFTYTAPSIGSTSLILSVSAVDGTGAFSIAQKAGLSADATGVILDVPAAQSLTVPANLATAVSVTTPFSWSAYTGGISILTAAPAGVSGPTFYVFTSATTTTLPDVGSAGFPLPATSNYQWSIRGLAPVANIDAVALPGGFNQLVFGDLVESVTALRSFTTAP
jgi:hypothetical protein